MELFPLFSFFIKYPSQFFHFLLNFTTFFILILFNLSDDVHIYTGIIVIITEFTKRFI